MQYVETEYSQICTDKEFVFPLSSNVGITFLENNPDYGSYDGYYVDVNVKRNILSPQKRFTERKSIAESDAYLRLLLGISHSFSSINLFAVKRTWIQKAIFSPIISGIINDIRFGEAGVELLTLISAKYYYDNELPQKYRDVTQSTKHRRRILSESSDSRYPYLNQYIRDGTYECHFKPFVDCIKQNVEMNSTKNVDVGTIRWVLTPYLERRQFLLSTYNQLLRKFNWVLRIIPTIVLRKLQSLIAQATKTREFNAGIYEKLILELIHKETMRDSVKRRNIDLPFIW